MNDEARKTKLEGMTKSEIRHARIEVLIIRVSDFRRHSPATPKPGEVGSFAIGHLFS
jgi:hypothetical protein